MRVDVVINCFERLLPRTMEFIKDGISEHLRKCEGKQLIIYNKVDAATAVDLSKPSNYRLQSTRAP